MPPNREDRPGDTEAAPTTRQVDGTENTAQRLLGHELHVFPADHPDHKQCIGKHGPDNPCDGKRGKHPAVKWGVWAIAPTPQTISLGWRKHRGACNIGIACGPSSLVVLDEDAAGELQRWCDAHGITLPPTYTVSTGRGNHYYFRWDHTKTRIGNHERIFDGYKINVRGDGGYVIGEGSQHESGIIYTGNDRPIAELPDTVANLLLLSTEIRNGNAPADQESFFREAPDYTAGRHRGRQSA